MTFELGSFARRAAFNLLHVVRRTDFHRQLKEVRQVNEGQVSAAAFQQSAVASLIEAAASSDHYRQFAGRELADFPVLNKATLKANTASFRTRHHKDGEMIQVSTSGSYGVPLTLDLTRQKKLRQHAEVVYFGEWAGYRVGSPHLYVRAHAPKSRLKLWAQNEWFSSTNRPTAEWAQRQVSTLQKKKLQAIIGFPSTITLLAETARGMGLGPEDFQVRASITIGEALRNSQREIIEATFGGHCLSRYTAEEVGVMAAECPEENVHHINQASYVVEILDEGDQPAPTGTLGRIVITDLFSHAMPLIRYDIGDVGVMGTNCLCGRPTPFIERIEGRTIESIVNAEGTTLNPFFINAIMKSVTGVHQFQFSQTAERVYELRLVGDAGTETGDLTRQLHEILGEGADLSIRPVDVIPALPSGKRPYVINEWQRSQSS